MEFDQQTYKLKDSGKFGLIALVIGVIGLVFSGVGYVVNSGQFFHSYLTAFTYWTSIGIGGLFLTLIHHLTGARWSIVIRRFVENIMTGLPLMFFFFIPVILGMHELYHWTHPDTVINDVVLIKKVGYLNTPFFIIRTVGYFVIWGALSFFLYKNSTQHDRHADDKLIGKMRAISAPGMILFALTVTYAAFDWLMSLDPHWFSTIFGVQFFAGSVVAALCLLILLIMHFHHRGVLTGAITVEHYHDIGKLLFAFTIFWAYMSFSQYFLIWYANIPEETVWFTHRWQGGWKYLSLTLLFGHFVLPFFLMMPRLAKRNPIYLSLMAVWLLIMHWVDLYWLVFPTFNHHDVHYSWMDATTLVGIGGIYLWFIWRNFSRNALVPINDPLLSNSINFKNA